MGSKEKKERREKKKGEELREAFSPFGFGLCCAEFLETLEKKVGDYSHSV